MPRYFIGVDPGASGGYARLDSQYGPDGTDRMEPPAVTFRSAAEDDLGNWLVLNDWINFDRCSPKQCVVCLEKVGGYVGGIGQPGSSMFNFGANYGILKAFLVAAGMREGNNLYLVRPQDWQKHLGISPRMKGKRDGKKETTSQWKNRLKSEAEKRFPKLKITLSTSDALLIALYCREVYS